jgi:hypothetical protein
MATLRCSQTILAARKLIVVLPIIAGATGLFIDAPFGRFAPSGDSLFLVHGKHIVSAVSHPPSLKSII